MTFCLISLPVSLTPSAAAHLDLTPDPGAGGFWQTRKGAQTTFQLSDSQGHYCVIFGLEQIDPSVPAGGVGGIGLVRQTVTMVNSGNFTIDGVCITYAIDSTTVRVSDITGVAWNVVVSPLDTNPNPGGGKRMFPDWTAANWDPDPDDIVAWVWPTATLSPAPTDPTQKVEVLIQVFDVDDPSANKAPVDDEAQPSDNRGGAVFVRSNPPAAFLWVESDTNGSAGDAFRVSLNPGDNYRAMAGFHNGEISGYSAKQDDGELARLLDAGGQPPAASRFTQDLLTVWRKVHVEVDKLAAPMTVFSNPTWAEGTISQTFFFAQGNYTALLVDGIPGGTNGGRTDDLYNGGGLKAGGQTTAWGVNDFNYLHGDDAHVYVNGNRTGSNGAGYEMADDDHDYTVAGFPLKVQFPLSPDTSYLGTVFKPAYIEPEFNEVAAAQYNGTVTLGPSDWNMDLDRFKILSFTHCGVRKPNNVPRGHSMYWCAYLLGAFQPDPAEDMDPDSENIAIGYTDPDEHRGAVVFLEGYRDFDALMTAQGKSLKPFSWVVAHEMGHEFTLCHTVGSYREAPQETGWIVQRNGNQIVIDKQLKTEGFSYIGAMLLTYDNELSSVVRSQCRIESLSNDPQNDQCTVTVTIVSGTPVENQFFVLYENSIMCGRAILWNDGVFSPRDLDVLRHNTESPVRP